MSGELVAIKSLPGDIDRLIDEVSNETNAKDAVKNMERLKKMLDLAEEYGTYAVQFCVAEAKLYLKIASIDNAESQLTKAKRELVEWIREKMDAGEIDAVMESVATGTRIATIKNRECNKGAAAKAKEVLEEYKRISDGIISDYEHNSCTTLTVSRFFDEWRLEYPVDYQTAKGHTERTRDRLLKMDAVGLSDGNGTYVNPENIKTNQAMQAIKVRLESIYNDLVSLANLCRTSHVAVPKRGIEMLHKSIREIAECGLDA